LASNRASFHAFFLRQHCVSYATLTFVHAPLAEGVLEARAHEIERVAAAIVDIGADTHSGVRLCAALRATRPDLSIVAVAGSSKLLRASHVHELIANHVHFVADLQTRTTLDELLDQIEEVCTDGSPAHVRGSYGGFVSAARRLSLANRRLLELVARGWSDNKLGVQLGVSARTIRARIERLRDDLGVHSREELAAWAGAHGLYQPPVAPGPLPTSEQSGLAKGIAFAITLTERSSAPVSVALGETGDLVEARLVSGSSRPTRFSARAAQLDLVRDGELVDNRHWPRPEGQS
jgi:DNA-binding NarL/FixJ family response regulator